MKFIISLLSLVSISAFSAENIMETGKLSNKLTQEKWAQVHGLNSEGNITHTAKFLNELTGAKWDEQMKKADLVWSENK